jgi:hypothetical protein
VRERDQLPAFLRTLVHWYAAEEGNIGPNAHLLRPGEEALQVPSTRVDHENEGEVIETVVVAGVPLRDLQGLSVAFCFSREAL